MAEAFQACRAASQSISATSNGGRGSQEAADACSPRRWAIRRRHSAVDEGRGSRVVARHIPDRVIKPITHRVPNINPGDLQIPPVLNEPIPMKPVKKATSVIDYDQILAPVNIDVTLKGQLPTVDMEKGFEAIHTTAEQLPDLEFIQRR